MKLEPHFTTRQVAELLAVCEETVRRAAARGELRSLRVGHDRRYPESAVREWFGLLAARAVEGRAA
jgi:excisionase family DNA binding protein